MANKEVISPIMARLISDGVVPLKSVYLAAGKQKKATEMDERKQKILFEIVYLI